jgi:hypothetical protein
MHHRHDRVVRLGSPDATEAAPCLEEDRHVSGCLKPPRNCHTSRSTSDNCDSSDMRGSGDMQGCAGYALVGANFSIREKAVGLQSVCVATGHANPGSSECPSPAPCAMRSPGTALYLHEARSYAPRSATITRPQTLDLAPLTAKIREERA